MLDPQVSPEEIKSREVEPGLRVGLLLHQLFLNSGATDIVFVIVLHNSLSLIHISEPTRHIRISYAVFCL